MKAIINKSFSHSEDFNKNHSEKDIYTDCEFLAIYPLYPMGRSLQSPRVEDSAICSISFWGNHNYFMNNKNSSFFDCIINASTFKKVIGKGNRFYGNIIYDELLLVITQNDNNYVTFRRKSDNKVFTIKKYFREDESGYSTNMVINDDGTWEEWEFKNDRP